MRSLAALGVTLMACTGAAPAPGDEQQPANGVEQESAAAGEREVVSVPTDWVSVKSSCGYSFRAPPELVMQAVGAIDSCTNGWATRTCVYRGDYGAFSSDLGEYREAVQYEETQVAIDGHSAKLVTALSDESLVAAVYFPSVEREVEGTRLTLWANCQDGAGQQDALRVFRTITFAARVP